MFTMCGTSWLLEYESQVGFGVLAVDHRDTFVL